MRKTFSYATCCLTWVLLVGLATEVSAQQASVQGAVRDETGAVVPGATVRVRNPQTGAAESVLSDEVGRYEVRLGAGTYEVAAEFPGFTNQPVGVTLAAGQSSSVDLILRISPFAETVTVTRTEQTSTTVPMAVAVIGADEIQFARRQEALAETLQGVPGIFAENRRNFSLAGGVQVTIRAPMVGFGMRGIQVFQDSIPLTTADGTTQPTNLDLGAAGQMEVIRGPNSVLYGNAAGGVISLQTQFPSADRLWLEPDIQFGSFGYNRLQLKAQGTSGRMAYVFNVNRIETDGFRLHSAAEVRRANLVVRAAVSPDTEIRGAFNLFDMPFGESASTITEEAARNDPTSVRPGFVNPFRQGWGESATQAQGGVTVEHHFGGGHILRATGWGAGRDVWNPIPFRIIDLGRTAGGFRSEYKGSADSAALPVSWTAGFDVSLQSDNRIEYENALVPPGGDRAIEGPKILEQLEEVTSLAPYVQVTVTLHPQWFATAGVRYDHYDFRATYRFLGDGDQSGDRTMSAVSPMAGITFVPSNELNLYANFSTAYQTPTTVELSNKPTGEGGFNEDLDPEDLRSVEVGARGLVGEGRVRYELVAYFSVLDNAFVELQRPDEQTYFANAFRSARDGLEARIDWTPTPEVRTFASYTYQNFKFDDFEIDGDDFTGNTESGAPPHQLYLSGTYEAPFGLRSTLQYRWVDEYFVNNANSATNWSYQVVDLRFGLNYQRDGLEIQPFFGIDNLFDERYNGSTIPNGFGGRYYEPSPGREFYVGFRLGGGVL